MFRCTDLQLVEFGDFSPLSLRQRVGLGWLNEDEDGEEGKNLCGLCLPPQTFFSLEPSQGPMVFELIKNAKGAQRDCGRLSLLGPWNMRLHGIMPLSLGTQFSISTVCLCCGIN